MGSICGRNSLSLYDGNVVARRYSSDELRTKGLAIDPVTSNLYVCDDILVGINVFSSNFNLLFTFKNASLRNACGICVSHDKVFIPDVFTSVIFVFTLEGYIFSKYSLKTRNKCYLLSPCGVAVDNNGDIYTCSHLRRGNKIFVLTHDEDRNYYFARSSLKSPRDVKLYRDNVIVLDLSNGTNSYHNLVELKVYSKKEELLNVIRLENFFCVKFFDVTPNSNYIISSLRHIIFVSNNGHILKIFGSTNFEKQTMYQTGIVLDSKKMDIVGLRISGSNPLSFYRYPIGDRMYCHLGYWTKL